jgi:hypothetical protein
MNTSRVDEYVAECRRQNKMIVIAKNFPRISQLETDIHGLVINYYGMLFDIWEEIVKANNYT